MLTFESLRQQFDLFCAENPIGNEPAGLYDPAKYIMSLGGKRLRPLLLLAGYGLYKEDYNTAMFPALGVEVFHNFTLLHDDILDSATLRRGKSTAHTIYGQNSAILSGDVMLIRSFDFIMRSCPAEALEEIMQLMLSTARKICEGQQLDMDFETKSDVSVDEYLYMNTLKTAALLGTCLKMGAILAGASKAQADTLYDAGISFGKAFQVQDDLLDVYGRAGKTGKKRGGDIVNGKKTFLYTKALNTLSSRRKNVFVDLYHEQAANPEVKIQRVLGIFNELNVEELASKYINEVYAEGIECVQTVDGSPAHKSLLLNYIQSLVTRES